MTSRNKDMPKLSTSISSQPLAEPADRFTQGLKSIDSKTRVYITSLGKHDISGIYEYVGQDLSPSQGYVNVFPRSMSGNSLKFDTAEIEKTFEDFRVGSDYLCITGRGFTNFIIGSIISRLFGGEVIDLLLYDARTSLYYTVKWEVPAANDW